MRPDDHDIDEEIRGHLAIAIQERIARGEDPETARLAALREFGYVPHLREEMRRVWYSRWFDMADALVQDMRVGLRSLLRAKGMAATVVITLALGIGANAAIFSLVYGVLLRPLPYRDADRIVSVWTATASDRRSSHSAADFIDLQRENISFTAIAGWREDLFAVAADAVATLPVQGAHVTVDFFDVLGLPSNAPVGEIRRVCARRVRRSHPDFRTPFTAAPSTPDEVRSDISVPRDVAVDFVDVTALLDRIELSFFRSES